MINSPRASRLSTLMLVVAVWAGLDTAGDADQPAPAGPVIQQNVIIPPAAANAAAASPARDLDGINYDSDPPDRHQRLSFGGYGEIHANWVQGPGNDQIDLHRLVLSPQYDFTTWLTFLSEIEVEHAFVAPDGGGEVSVEQAYIEYEACEWLRIRAGRVLVPVGLVNRHHEPIQFNGVERPAFDRFIIPSTWFADGIGARGNLLPSLTYEAYVLTSLNGSEFNAVEGIREGRIEGTGSLNQPAFSGRLDWFPMAVAPSPGQQFLRFGVSTFLGGLDNGNEGQNPGIDGTISIISSDFEYRLWRLEFRGEFAYERIPDAAQIGNGTASGILGWCLEAGVHVFPEDWRCGRLQHADAVVFTRYDLYNTQYQMPTGVAADPAGDRNEWTVGMGFFPVPNFVVKVDYQIPRDATGEHLPRLFNAGLGWQF